MTSVTEIWEGLKPWLVTKICKTMSRSSSRVRDSKSAIPASKQTLNGFPDKQGLYNPANEHDACGVGFVANLKNVASHQIIKDGLFILENLTHRGAVGADPLMGDGAGILVQMPHKFFAREMAQTGHYSARARRLCRWPVFYAPG